MEGHGCPPIAGHITSLSEREGERDARARDREARGLVAFEARWPSAAADDRQRTAYAWAELSAAEREEAIAGIAPFLDNLKRLGRKGVPAGWKYLEERRWTLLEQPKGETPVREPLPGDGAEAKAVELIYTLANKRTAFFTYVKARDGLVYYRREVTPQLLALAAASPSDDWPTLTRQQAGAWNGLIDEYVTADIRGHLREGDRAPWPWPPSKDGKIYEATAPPEALMSEQDWTDAANMR